MKSIKKAHLILIGVLCLIIVSSVGIFVSYQQAHNPSEYLVKVLSVKNEDDVTSYVRDWVSGYLKSHQKSFNFKNKIDSYRIDVVSLEHEVNGSYYYRIKFTANAKKNLDMFETKPERDGDQYIYDLLAVVRIDGDYLRFVSDSSYKDYDKTQIFLDNNDYLEEDVDSLRGLHRNKDSFLEVRSKEGEEWIKTPILYVDFNLKHQGWFQNDKRIHVDDKNIFIVNKAPEGIVVFSSTDFGKNWKKDILLNDEELINLSGAYVDFDGDHGFISVLSYVAINSEVMTIFETKDNGNSWLRGETPNRNVHIHDSSVLDDTLYFTNKNSTSLFTTHDLGMTYDELLIPEGTLEVPPLSNTIGWKDIFIQALAPYKKNGQYYILVTQGENGDYNGNINARYISRDNGKTWEFDGFEQPLIIEEPN